MPSDTVTALNNALKRLTNDMEEENEKVRKCQDEVDRIKAGLQAAETQAECAAYELRKVGKDLNALRDLYNNSIEKPQALLPQIELLQKEQSEAAQRSEKANGVVRAQQGTLHDAETRLAVAKETYEKVQGQWQEVSALLRQETNKL